VSRSNSNACTCIRGLSKCTQAIAKGRYDHHITVKRGDEIGQLAVDCNYMADASQANTELLQQAVQEIEHFIASLAHELKKPLTSIMGYADLLQYYHLDEQPGIQALQFIRNGSKRLDDISIKLLELFRLSLMQQAELITRFSLPRKGHLLDMKSSITAVAIDQELVLVLLSNLIGPGKEGDETVHVYGKILDFEPNKIFSYTEHPGPSYNPDHASLETRITFRLDEVGKWCQAHSGQ
jgi:signal transduction histidine kinase